MLNHPAELEVICAKEDLKVQGGNTSRIVWSKRAQPDDRRGGLCPEPGSHCNTNSKKSTSAIDRASSSGAKVSSEDGFIAVIFAKTELKYRTLITVPSISRFLSKRWGESFKFRASACRRPGWSEGVSLGF
jgi:hypothetical protein